MASRSFCGILSLETGVVILAFTFIELVLIISTVNMHSFIDDFPADGLKLVLSFMIALAAAGAAMITAVKKESRRWCLIALGLNVIMVVIIFVGSSVSLANKPSMTDYVCVEDRCPETLWCAPLTYRRIVVHQGTRGTDATREQQMRTTAEGTKQTKNTEPSELTQESGSTIQTLPQQNSAPTTTTPMQQQYTTPLTTTPRRQQQNTAPSTLTTQESKEDEEYDASDIRLMNESQYVIGFAFYAAVTLFILNFIFFVFCTHIVFSFYQELTHKQLHES